MAGNTTRIGAVRMDIVADNGDFVRKMKASTRMTRDLYRAMNATRTPMERYTKKFMDANAALKRGQIDQKAYRYELSRLQRQLYSDQIAFDKETNAVNRNTAAKVRNAKVSKGLAGKNLANMLGSSISGLGLGGAAAGAGRGLGLAAIGPSGTAIAAATVEIGLLMKQAKEYSKLESDIVELQVFMGKKKGKEYADQFRNIARESSLTTSQLVKNAAVIKSYGVELENIVDFTKRLGEASGGDTMQFNSLTRAFAQINALGKLMGQEKNQLVNAGFSLQLIADEAGVPMAEFAKAMEDGLITAQHVNDALISATSEGGLYFGRLQAKAETLAGKWDILLNNTNEMFAVMGEGKNSWFKTTLDGLTQGISDLTTTISLNNQLIADEEKIAQIERMLGQGPSAQKEFMRRLTPDQALGGDAGYDTYMDEAGRVNVGYEIAQMWGRWTSGHQGFFEAISTSAEEFELQQKQRIQQAKYKLDALRQRLKKQGLDDPTELEDAPADPKLFTPTRDITAEDVVGSAAAKSNTLKGGFQQGTVEEYKFLRDKVMGSRDYAKDSYDELKRIADNTSVDLNGQSWRANARESINERNAQNKVYAEQFWSGVGYVKRGFQTLAEQRLNRQLNEIGEPSGRDFDAERKKRSDEIYEKYAGEDGLLSSRFIPGDNYERAFNFENSEWGRWTTEVREMTKELRAQYKREKNNEERRQEIREIKNNVKETQGVKGVLNKIYKHMKETKSSFEGV
jgi:tape measure domain-containing protein